MLKREFVQEPSKFKNKQNIQLIINNLYKRSICKRASKLIHSNDEQSVLIGDKTGDVYVMKLDLDNLDQCEVKLLMGSLSMLTDMRFYSNEKFLITSDRDEKIRVSCYPNSYNIDSYLLGHKE